MPTTPDIARQDRIALLKEDLRNAKTRAEKRKLRKKLAKQKAKVAELRAIARLRPRRST